MILTVLFVMTMFLWGLSLFTAVLSGAQLVLAFLAVLLLGLYQFVPALRG